MTVQSSRLIATWTAGACGVLAVVALLVSAWTAAFLLVCGGVFFLGLSWLSEQAEASAPTRPRHVVRIDTYRQRQAIPPAPFTGDKGAA